MSWLWSARFIIVKIGSPLASRACSTRTLGSIAAGSPASLVVGESAMRDLLPRGRPGRGSRPPAARPAGGRRRRRPRRSPSARRASPCSTRRSPELSPKRPGRVRRRAVDADRVGRALVVVGADDHLVDVAAARLVRRLAGERLAPACAPRGCSSRRSPGRPRTPARRSSMPSEKATARASIGSCDAIFGEVVGSPPER